MDQGAQALPGQREASSWGSGWLVNYTGRQQRNRRLIHVCIKVSMTKYLSSFRKTKLTATHKVHFYIHHYQSKLCRQKLLQPMGIYIKFKSRTHVFRDRKYVSWMTVEMFKRCAKHLVYVNLCNYKTWWVRWFTHKHHHMFSVMLESADTEISFKWGKYVFSNFWEL